MGLLLKIGNLFVKKPLAWVNLALDGKKTYLGALLIIFPALTCLVRFLIDVAPIDLGDLQAMIHSDCIKQLGEGLAIIGGAHKISKMAKI